MDLSCRRAKDEREGRAKDSRRDGSDEARRTFANRIFGIGIFIYVIGVLYKTGQGIPESIASQSSKGYSSAIFSTSSRSSSNPSSPLSASFPNAHVVRMPIISSAPRITPHNSWQ